MARRAEASRGPIERQPEHPVCRHCAHWRKRTVNEGGCAFWEKYFNHPMRYADESCGYWQREGSKRRSY